jgi:predicted O-methyltransferase YrrM
MKMINTLRRAAINVNAMIHSLATIDGSSEPPNSKLTAIGDGNSGMPTPVSTTEAELALNVAARASIDDRTADDGVPPVPEEWKVDLRPLHRLVDESELPAKLPVTMESIQQLLSCASYKDIIRPYFADYPKMSLMAAECRAFIYSLVRVSKPDLVAEIGTFFAGTAEVFARALWENGRGMLYTTDPYGAERGPAVIRQWPAPLQEIVRFSPDDSMTFLGNLAHAKTLLDIILIDGNHQYEFAGFDLAMAAKMMRPGGIIIMDNAEQTGPFEAARQFLTQYPEWQELGNCISSFELSNPFAMPRCSIPGTSFIVLQASFKFTIGPKLRSWGEEAAPSMPRSPDFVLELSPQRCRGRLHFQAVYRGFDWNGGISEELRQQGSIAIELDGEACTVEHRFDKPLVSDIFARFHPNCHHTFELELLWEAAPDSGSVTLAAKPQPQWNECDADAKSGLGDSIAARDRSGKIGRTDLTPLLSRLYGDQADQPNPRTRLVNDTIETLAQDHVSVSWGDRLLTLDKSADFKKEPAFAQSFAEIQGSHQYDQYNGPDSIAWRLNTLVWAARCGLRTGGDFVECGTFKGDMAWVVLHAIGAERISRFWLFDSFEGFSPDYSSAGDFRDNPGFLDFANGFYREAGLYEYVRDRFASFANVRVVRGFLPETLDAAGPDRIGFLHIDLNSPRAEIAVLERLFDRVLPGGVIVFDDYGWKMFHKQKEAEDDFMRRRGYEILELPTGQGLVVKR